MVVLTNNQLRIRSLVAACLGALLVFVLYQQPQAKATSTHVSVNPAVFDIARSVCRNNGGYREVRILKAQDRYTFVCADGLSLTDSIVRVQ